MSLIFSNRIHVARANRLALELGAIRSSGTDVIDLTESNPTTAGIDYPPGMLAPLGGAAAARYEPHPFGLASAREAVADDFARRGTKVSPDRIALTASTSEAYSLLFKLLCDPGDRVLVPRPSYPLFEYLARLDAVTAVPYDLDYHSLWRIDADSVKAALGHGTRALIVVSPNNPTGSCLHPDDLELLGALAREHGFALIGDEVFADYPMEEATSWPSILEADGALAFGLGGLSKSAGLPQVKLGWIAVSGPTAIVEEALARLEIACDAYLSVSTPVQQAAPALLEAGAAVRARIAARVRTNYRALVQVAGRYPASSVLPIQAGWYAVVQVPNRSTEEELAVALLREKNVLVHPGYFFDFPREAFLIVSLLPPADRFLNGVERLFEHAG